jgi:hypothetical protein
LFAVSNGLAMKIRAWGYNNLPSKPMLTGVAKFTADASYPSNFEHKLTLELQAESNLEHSWIVLLLGNDAKVWRIQAVAGVLEAHIIEDIKCVGAEL